MTPEQRTRSTRTAHPWDSTTAAVRMHDCHRCGNAVYAGLVHHCPTSIRSYDVSELVAFRPQPDGSLTVEPW